MKPIGVVGLGLLGRGIAACLLAHGKVVVAVTRTADEITQALPVIANALKELVEHQVLPALQVTDWSARWRATTDYAALASCEFIIESVTEDLAVKQACYDAIEAVVDPQAIIASNTSAIPITLLQQSRRYPGRFVGVHWAEPAHATRFLELIRGEATTEETLQRAITLGLQLGKDPTLCQKDIPGFIVNRIGYAMYREALHLFELGVADIETIDRALRYTLGLWAASCGPFRWIDLTGGPALYARAMQRVLPTLCNSPELPPTLQKFLDVDPSCRDGSNSFYHDSPEVFHQWEARQRRHVWMIRDWFEREFPAENPPSRSISGEHQ